MKAKIPSLILCTILSALMISSCKNTQTNNSQSISDSSDEKATEITTNENSETDTTTQTTTQIPQSTDVNKNNKTSQTKKTYNSANKKSGDKTVYDKPVVNKAVDNAVKNGKKENFVCTNTYNFGYENIKKVYSNKEMNKCFERLKDICNNADFDLSFAFENVKTGAKITYNSYSSFMTCSTIKAPFVKSLLESKINLNEKITKYGSWEGDNGYVAGKPDGTVFTAKELIKYTITKSDNTAYLMVKQHFGYANFNNMLYRLGANYSIGDSWIFTSCTAEDMLKCFVDIYKFGKNNKQGEWLTQLMQNTDVTMQITQALGAKYKVSHKYGTDCIEKVFNDCAIVYADSPFVLCIFTKNQIPETKESSKVFRNLAVVFDDINRLIAK